MRSLASYFVRRGSVGGLTMGRWVRGSFGGGGDLAPRRVPPAGPKWVARQGFCRWLFLIEMRVGGGGVLAPKAMRAWGKIWGRATVDLNLPAILALLARQLSWAFVETMLHCEVPLACVN